MKHVRVYRKGSNHELSLRELIKEGGLGFIGISEEEMTKRISGNHCSCGPNNGEFDLLPLDDPVIIEGGKRYMICRKCGCYSHL